MAPAAEPRSRGARAIPTTPTTPTTPASEPGLLEAVLSATVGKVSAVVKPEAAAAVAQTFGFPLALMVAVVLFLIVQGRVDDRDPKLRAAPLTTAETVVPFQEEQYL